MRALVPLVKEVGELARTYFWNVTAERKADRSVVTEADRIVEERLTSALHAELPHVRILGEEFGASGPADSPYTLTLDPIDGTSAFVAGLPTWCVTVGLVHDGQAVGGLTYLPMTGETYLCENDEASWNGRVLPRGPGRPSPSDFFIVAHSDYHRGSARRFPGKVRALGSTAYHLALVARGAAAGALIGRPRIWDLAAGAALVNATGGSLRLRSGAHLDVASLLDGGRPPEPVVAAGPGLMDDLLPLIAVVT
jgi:myo-inositol-1(or 4)-monophosphatase